jgi:hypothetical protein
MKRKVDKEKTKSQIITIEGCKRGSGMSCYATALAVDEFLKSKEK